MEPCNDWYDLGCRNSCYAGHTYIYSDCFFGKEEPVKKPGRWIAKLAFDGEMAIFWEEIDNE